MDMATSTSTDALYKVLVALLFTALATGFALLFLATGGSATTASVNVAAAESVDCPFGSGSPVCYQYAITNPGDTGAFVRCQVTPSGDTTAVFGNGETIYEGAAALDGGDTLQLYVQVQPGSGDVVTEPVVGCAAAP